MRKQEWVSTRNERFSSLELKWRVWNTQPITVFVFRFFLFFVFCLLFFLLFCLFFMSLVQSQSAVSKCIIYISVLFITKCRLCDIPLSSVPQCSWHWCTFSKKKTKELANHECQTHQNRHFDQKNIRERAVFIWKSNPKLLWFCVTARYNWYKKIPASPIQPNRRKIETNRNLLASVFRALLQLSYLRRVLLGLLRSFTFAGISIIITFILSRQYAIEKCSTAGNKLEILYVLT